MRRGKQASCPDTIFFPLPGSNSEMELQNMLLKSFDFTSAPTANPGHLFRGDAQREQKLVVPLGCTPFEFPVPAFPGFWSHARRLERLHPQLLVNRW